MDKPWKKGDKVRNKYNGKVVEVYAYQPTHRTIGLGKGSGFIEYEKGFTYIDDEGDAEIWTSIDEYELIKEDDTMSNCKTVKMTLGSGIVIEVSAEELAKMNRLLGERDPREQFEKGDKVRLLSGGNNHPLNGFVNGDIYTVTDPKSNVHNPENRIEIEGGAYYTGYAKVEQLEKVDDIKFEVGDYARVVGGTYNEVIDEGAYVEILTHADSDGDYTIGIPDGKPVDFAKPESLERVELNDRDLTFLKIGRKPGEFKKGDIVEYDDEEWFENSGIGEVVFSHIEHVEVNAVDFEGDKMTYSLDDEIVRLIAPVESRVDRDE